MRGPVSREGTDGSHAPGSVDRPVRWPDAFGNRFTLFVDTEEEFDWSKPFDRSARETTAIDAVPDADRRLRDGGAVPVYLVDHPVATSPRAIEALAPLLTKGSGIGAQLHPWVTPPFDEDVNIFNSFPGNLSSELEEKKLVALTEAIVDAFSHRPRIYRAGRYGIGQNTFAALLQHGYLLDSSMRSRYDYRPESGADFSAIGNRAFFRDDIVELPLTTVFTGRLRRHGARLYPALGRIPAGRGVLARSGMLSRVAMTPEDMPLGEVREAIRVAAGEGLRVLNFSFHSPSLVPGHTPYVRNSGDLSDFYRWWDGVFEQLASSGYAAASEFDILEAIEVS